MAHDTTGADAIRAQLGGTLLLPDESGYDEARTVWNAMIDRRPRMIVRCASVGDVVVAIRTAREQELEIGVKCGGHSVVGHAVPDGGLMIDLTPMGAVRIDPERQTAHVQGGALLGALDRATQQHGLATTAGNVSHTGVGGLTLGGGMGWLARRFGLTCDNVLSFEMVTADGEVVRASASENPDLDWGLRGGGGNFGVVTDFELQLHPVDGRTLIATLSFPLEQAQSVLSRWRDLSAEAPREATFTALIASDGTVSVGFVWVGDPDRGRLLLPSLRALGRPISEQVMEKTYVDLQRMDDTGRGGTVRKYWKGHYLTSLPDGAIDALLVRDGVDGHRDMLPDASLQAYGGAIADVADEATAFSHRGTLFEYVAATGWTDPAEDETRMAVARQSAAALEPFASGLYVNAMADEGAAGVRRAYPPAKLERLRALKAKYDPHNVFHLNANITPA
ncbi:FAD-binding oxidoreductase [Diaminobutyricimonas sp. LJ205]|uniref:FAD-binding oxidoreductase n=1 Tax=Diaminobutyricimonas sp. LJ205 TaxID=2683590 RepID=UPI0012F4E24E|nr:FAD-binding oxidoreductase [Diaminobutyricimonas sp. LJ205]